MTTARYEVREFNSDKVIGVGTIAEVYTHPATRQRIACVVIPGYPGRFLRPLSDLRTINAN